MTFVWYFARQPRHEEAVELLKECLAIRTELGDKAGKAVVLDQLGQILQDSGDLDGATENYHESLMISEDIRDRAGMARTLYQLGTLAQARRDFDSARNYYMESMALNTKLGAEARKAQNLHQLASLAVEQGNQDEASRFESQSQEILERMYLKDQFISVLAEHATEDDLRNMADSLDIQYDQLPGEGPRVKARELVTSAYQRKQMMQLRTAIQEQCPQIVI